MPNFWRFRKSTFYAGVRIANILPRRLTALRIEKAQIKVALGRRLNTLLLFVEVRPVPQFTLLILWVLHFTSNKDTYFTGAAVALLSTQYPLQQRHLSCRESSFCPLYLSVRVSFLYRRCSSNAVAFQFMAAKILLRRWRRYSLGKEFPSYSRNQWRFSHTVVGKTVRAPEWLRLASAYSLSL